MKLQIPEFLSTTFDTTAKYESEKKTCLEFTTRISKTLISTHSHIHKIKIAFISNKSDSKCLNYHQLMHIKQFFCVNFFCIVTPITYKSVSLMLDFYANGKH